MRLFVCDFSYSPVLFVLSPERRIYTGFDTIVTMKRPPIADSIGQPHHQKNNMNPAALERLAKYSVYPVKSAGFLMRKSSYYRRDFYCLIMGRKAQTNMRIFTERNSRFLAPSVRHATTNAFGASSAAETVGLLLGTSAIIGGGIYYYSHCLKVSGL